MTLRLAFVTSLLLGACDSGDPAVCREAAPTCADANQFPAIDAFSTEGCEEAIDHSFCGTDAQALAECLFEAAICVDIGASRDAVAAVLTASVCAREFAAWDDCRAEGSGGGGGDDDDDD